ncbi:MAG TPA: RseA family anti-sigma factor [Burkholderiales bacterium]|nr:RseA family anti-sigma factor [Burkholderiales bacterium]
MSINASRLLDGDFAPAEVKPLLDEVSGDPALRDRYTVYALVGDILRGNSTPDDGFTLRILERMRERGARIEPGYDPLADNGS